jgi:hypothetical protein
MLFKTQILDDIARGEVDLAFRRWKRPTIKEGTRLRTPIGAIVIGEITPIEASELAPEDAKRAGFNDIAALIGELRAGEGRTIFKISLVGVEHDDRTARQNEKLTTIEISNLTAVLARWGKTAPIADYHTKILQLIFERPGVAAAELAELLGVEKFKLKRDVHKLKELGLTISLNVGYRLSSRGESLLEGLK